MGSVRLVHSITWLAPGSAAGDVVVTGSHGGRLTASFALAAGAAGLIAHDAGIGRDWAGIEGLALLDEWGIPAAAVRGSDAEIGNANAVQAKGIIEHVNDMARIRGVRPGWTSARAAAAMAGAAPHPDARIALPPPFFELATDDARTLWLLASASSITDAHRDAVVVTGSHANLIGDRPETALAAPVFAVVFNDAGSLRCTRLAVLDLAGIAAAAVATTSARIGDAVSTHDDGVISAVNAAATRSGARSGQPASEWVRAIRAAR